MKLLFAAVLSLWALAAALDQQGGRRLFLRQGENAPTETARTTANGTHTQWTEVGILEMANNGCPTGKKRQKDEDDMGLRFNKFEMLNGSDVTLDWKDYPLNDRLGSKLRYESNAISVILKDDFDVKDVCINKYIRAVGGYPAFPSNDTKSAFWPELFNVVRTQIARRNGVLPNPSVFTLPDLWKGWNVDQVGEAVHDEFPGVYHAELLKSFLDSKALKMDLTILPFRSKFDFVGSFVCLAALNTWTIGTVAPVNFYAKYHVGQPRPEEIAWLIAKREITIRDGVPRRLVQLINSMKLQNATSFTQYPEGSPRHPSWPAMHSAASSASLWLPVVADLTPEQYCQVLRTDFAVAYARTVAGVHYHSDNIAGLNMGQEVISEKLAEHLAESFGSNPEVVEAKIRKWRFDWSTFDSRTCTVKPKYNN